MKTFVAGVIAFTTIVSFLIAVISGIGVITDIQNTGALAILAISLIIALPGIIVCFKNQSCREWILGWLIPF